MLRPLYYRIILLGLLVLAVRPAFAQAPLSVAAVHRAVARTQLELLKKNLRYVAGTSSDAPADGREKARLQLVEATTAAVAELRKQRVAADQVPFVATTLRLFTAVLLAQQTKYKQVNEASPGRGKSLTESEDFWEGAAAAQLHVAQLTDSLEVERRIFAEENGLRQDVSREVRIWTNATRQAAELFGYFPQVQLPYVRVRMAMEPLLTAIQAHNGESFEAAHHNLAVEAGFAAAQLATVPDFMNLDITFRDVTRAFVKHQVEACGGSLAEAVDLMLLQKTQELTSLQVQSINSLLQAYIVQTQALDRNYQKASSAFLRLNAPDLAPDYTH